MANQRGGRNGYQKGLAEGKDKQVQELQRIIKELQRELDNADSL